MHWEGNGIFDMTRFVANLPIGPEIEIYSVDEAVRTILSDQVHWKAGSGDASIADNTFNGTRELQFMCRPGVGYVLSYLQVQGRHRQYMFAVNDASAHSHRTQVHSVFVGGEFYNYPATMFHSLKLTSKAIAEFMESSGPPASLHWENNLQRPLAPKNQEFGETY